tara:strand:- start:19 stop:717 length:699 start_codon:yes stop_codon:yes gene_type:complete
MPSPALWYEIKLEDNYINYLMKIIDESEKELTHNDIRETKKSLVGNISKSFSVLEQENKTKYFSKKYLSPCIKKWKKEHQGHPVNLESIKPSCSENDELIEKFELTSFWVNYQYKHEFNPPHTHSGVYSFVIWLKIPYDCKKEKLNKRFSGTKWDDRKAGDFQFMIPSHSPNKPMIHTHDYELDESCEGTMLFFPSTLHHQVFPFYTSDENRISMSGNIFFSLKEGKSNDKK